MQDSRVLVLGIILVWGAPTLTVESFKQKPSWPSQLKASLTITWIIFRNISVDNGGMKHHLEHDHMWSMYLIAMK